MKALSGEGATAPGVKYMSSALLKRLKLLIDSHTMTAVAQAAVEEVQEICVFLLMLTGDLQPETGSLNAIMHSKSGSRTMIRHVMGQKRFWKELELRAREFAVATLTYAPEMAKAQSDIVNMELHELAERVCPRLVLWKDGLLPGLLQSCFLESLVLGASHLVVGVVSVLELVCQCV